MTVVDVEATDNGTSSAKIALPDQKMNNGHNLWAATIRSRSIKTEWQGKSLYVNRKPAQTGSDLLTRKIVIGDDPAHVMTRVDTQQVHTWLNGDDGVMELNRLSDGKHDH